MRLWIKRGFHGTPASIQLNNDDLIDDVKDAVFRKYPVALARAYDAPDVSICLVMPSTISASSIESKVLAVDEIIGEILRHNFPGGQGIENALVIQVPAHTNHLSPYGVPVRNSPLSGTIGLMTQDMRNFEYFPETPPIGQHEGLNSNGVNDYTDAGKNFVPSNYSSASLSSASNPSQTSPTVLGPVGLTRPALNLSTSTGRYSRDRSRPGMGTRQVTINSNNAPTSGYNNRNEATSITFYPKQGRGHRATSSTSQSYVQHSSPTQNGASRNDPTNNNLAPPPALTSITLGDDRSLSPSVLPLTEQELSISSQPRQVSGPITTMTPLAETPEPKVNVPAAQNGRGRRDTLSHNVINQRPGLHRTLTASKLSLVSPAASAHSSSNSVHQLETKVKTKKNDAAQQSTFGVGGLLEGVVPPIVVLIVEDNMINQKILETFMKKRKIRCLTAKNGREAVEKWKKGGVHLVLMDIQMPVMSGIEAAKEIRRLERTNSIGVFSRQDSQSDPVDEADILTNVHFKSPVIIVALTASSLQSDRHEALAAGCNDFLTKPVSLVWLEKKVLEWGCMQALIDFEGWKQFRSLKESNKDERPKSARMSIDGVKA